MKSKSNKYIIRIVAIIETVLSICIVSVIVYAAQENDFDVPCDHNYEITDFNSGIATFTCTGCEDSYTESFIDHINESYEPLDAVEDGMINAKDYAKLIHTYQK